MSHPDRRGDARVRATTLRGLNNLKAVTQCVFQTHRLMNSSLSPALGQYRARSASAFLDARFHTVRVRGK